MWLFSSMSASPHLYGAWICCRSKYPDPTTTHSRTFPNTQWAPSLQHNSNWETLWPGARLHQVIHVQLQSANHGEWWKNPMIFDDFCWRLLNLSGTGFQGWQVMRNTFGWEKPGISTKKTLIDTWDVGRLWLRRGIQNLIPSRCFLFVCLLVHKSQCLQIYNII